MLKPYLNKRLKAHALASLSHQMNRTPKSILERMRVMDSASNAKRKKKPDYTAEDTAMIADEVVTIDARKHLPAEAVERLAKAMDRSKGAIKLKAYSLGLTTTQSSLAPKPSPIVRTPKKPQLYMMRRSPVPPQGIDEARLKLAHKAIHEEPAPEFPEIFPVTEGSLPFIRDLFVTLADGMIPKIGYFDVRYHTQVTLVEGWTGVNWRTFCEQVIFNTKAIQAALRVNGSFKVIKENGYDYITYEGKKRSA